MKKIQKKLNFEILIDDFFESFNLDVGLTPIENKKVLGLLNNFEDGEWRFSHFQNFIWDNIAETALSQRERDSLVNHSLLTAAAQNLRLTDKDKIGEGSELAEIILYGVMKHHFNALPVVPKIFYKQNPQDNAKGADSVHIVVTKDDFTIWFGEAKFYTSIEDVNLNRIVDSVANSIKTGKLKKENSIIINVNDIDLIIDDKPMCSRIREALSPQESIDSLKSKINIPILLLYECNITNAQTEMNQSYKNSIIQHQKERATAYFKKQLLKMQSSHKYSEICFHIILFPVPSKKKIVDKFLSNVKHYKEQ
ncbi:HamA C-terminal domain-containing protein [Pseudomonas sp. MDT1-17]